MNVLVRALFQPPTEVDWQDMKDLGLSLTNDPNSVRVRADDKHKDCLVVEFTMPDDAQHRAVSRIDRELRVQLTHRLDTAIGFPKTAEEQARAERKAARRRARRRAQ